MSAPLGIAYLSGQQNREEKGQNKLWHLSKESPIRAIKSNLKAF